MITEQQLTDLGFINTGQLGGNINTVLYSRKWIDIFFDSKSGLCYFVWKTLIEERKKYIAIFDDIEKIKLLINLLTGEPYEVLSETLKANG